MTKFNIQKCDLVYIFTALRSATSKLGRPSYEYIKFEGSNGVLTACAADGYRAHICSTSIDVTEGEKEFRFLLKPFVLPKIETPFISCELSEKEIMFDFGDRRYIERLGEGIEGFLDYKAAIPDSNVVFKIGFNPQFLADAAKSLRTKDCLKDALVMEFYGPLKPALLYNSRNKNDFRIVLPVMLRED